MAKSRPTPEQRFKQLFNLSHDESTTPSERETAERKWRKWLKDHNKKPIDIASVLAQAERDDNAANPPPPPPDPRANAPHVFNDPQYNPATLVDGIVGKYLVMRSHVRIVYVLWVVATHVYVKFRVAPRVLLTSENPDSGKTTALEVARALIFRANEESFATDAALRDHLRLGPGSIALDEGDLYEPAARRALLRLWNGGHAQGAKQALMIGGRRTLFDLFAPMIAAGLGRILGQAQLSRTFVLNMNPYGAGETPEFDWWAPAEDGPDSAEARKLELDTIYSYLRHCAATWKFNRQPSMPPRVVRRSADNFRSLLAVADVCGGDWPRRAREAIVALIAEMFDDQPKVVILRHGLLLFDQFEADQLEVNRFNQELRRLSAPEFDWNRFRGVSGLDLHSHPISINEQGRLLGASGVRAHSWWPPGVSRSQNRCQRIYRRVELEAALRKAESSSPGPTLKLVRPSDG